MKWLSVFGKFSLMALAPLAVALKPLAVASKGGGYLDEAFKLDFEFQGELPLEELGPITEEEMAIEEIREPTFPSLGVDFGDNVGVGLAPGIKCKVGRPRGEDGGNYCKTRTKEEEKRLDMAAKDLVIVTTNGTQTDAHVRLLRSAQTFAYNIKVLYEGEGFVKGDQQLKLLRDVVEKYQRENDKKLIIFLDGPDAILTSGPLRVVEEFDASEGDILLSSDGRFEGQQELEDKFPKVANGRRFFDSGAFVGRSEAIHLLLKEFPDDTNLQDLLTKAYAKESLRKKFAIKIDHKCNLFQNLNGASGDLELRFAGSEAYLQNTLYSTVPVVIRAQEQVTLLNTFSSYLARAWSENQGCRECWENMLDLDGLGEDEFPTTILAIFIEKPTPFLEEFLFAVQNMTYPKSKLNLFLHNSIESHKTTSEEWHEKMKELYPSIKYIPFEEKNIKEWHAKNMAFNFCLERNCTYIFFLDSDGILDNPHTLRLLIGQNRKVMAPMLPRPGKAWSNFWGSLTSDGFYARSFDYMDIIQNVKRGVWNVPYVSTSILVHRKVFEDPKIRPSFIKNLLDPDMAFCQNLREMGIFMYVTNRIDFGHLLSTENFNPTNVSPELWQITENRWDWERRYLHPNYSQALNESVTVAQPCPDVFWFPAFTERFAKELVELVESFGRWSSGGHDDTRIEGGYESVPTVDIHMGQVNYHEEWLELLRAYVQPLQLRVYPGYYNDPPRAQIAFVVRYKPDEQPSLRPHHDTSSYTINIGLNRPEIDYEGGGCRFIRYNCSVVNTRVGWMLMHPGRVTHLHEGLPVTWGTRYIVITFVDP